MEISLSPPSHDEIEVSIFGPGFGESILIHIGDNRWIVIDSCLYPDSNRPYPIHYLNQIGLEPSESIRYIVATHWHDDHIRGLSEIVRTCKNAEFICSAAFRHNEIISLVKVYSKRAMMDMTGVQILGEILQYYKDKKKAINIAMSNKSLFKINNCISSLGLNCEIRSLSPSDQAVLTALSDISKLFPQSNTTKRRIPSINPNHTSVVILVVIGELGILCGADLQETGNVNTGWSHILSAPPDNKSSCYKIPHHGSKNADNPRIWTNLLENSHIALLTPWALLGKYLPDENDINRIITNSLSEQIYITALPRWKKVRKRDSMVEKTIKEIGANNKQYNNSVGQVRLRINPIDKNNCKIDLFGEATNVSKL